MVHLIFYLFATIAVLSGIAVISARNSVRSALSLVVTFFAMSGLWMLMHAEFLSLILLLVYVGAVMTLFLFVVMMLNVDREVKERGFVRYLPFGIAAVLLTMGLVIIVLGPTFGVTIVPPPGPEVLNYNNLRELGQVLYTDYAYPFEIAGVILLSSIIAAITLTHRAPTRRRAQNIEQQVAIKPAEAVKLVKLKSEAREE